ncbi:MAG: hypothetical protein ACRD5H_08705 [Nitrososphaerales archaeon]
MVSADTAFVIVHLVHEFSPFLSNSFYSLETDRGYSEIFQYVKIYWIVILLAALWRLRREGVYVAWMLLYAYLLCDDAFQIHERGGGAIARHWGYENALGLRARDFGELTVAGALGLAFLVLIGIMYLRSACDARNASKDLTLLFSVIVFFGVIIDMLHIVAGDGYGNVVFGVIEDGGEMFATSAVCWYVLNLLERRGKAPTPLWRLTKKAVTQR